jgi:hypothetical protein
VYSPHQQKFTKHVVDIWDRWILITVRESQISWWGAFSLTWGRVCRLHSLLVLASAVILGSESRGTHNHILLSLIRDSHNLEGQDLVIIFPRNRVAQLYHPGTGFPFRRFLRLAGLQWRYSNLPPRGVHYNIQLVQLITPRNAQRRKRLFHYCCILLLPSKQACLRSRYLAMAYNPLYGSTWHIGIRKKVLATEQKKDAKRNENEKRI